MTPEIEPDEQRPPTQQELPAGDEQGSEDEDRDDEHGGLWPWIRAFLDGWNQLPTGL